VNIEHLKLFVQLATTNNISLAGQEFNLSPAVASSYISKLEKSLRVRLVYRTTRKVSLTEDGHAFLPHAKEVLSTIETALASVGVGDISPRGTLRIAAPASFGRMHIVPIIKEFLSRYPDLNIDIRLTDKVVDLVEGGFDVAIRNAPLKDSNLVARRLAPDKRIICASPSYLAEFGEPSSPSELLDHQCVILTGIETWGFDTAEGQINIRARGNFRTDNGEAMRDACVSGLGIAINATWSVYENIERGELVQILKEHTLVPSSAIWAVYPSTQLLAPKVRAFIDYLSSQYGDHPYWDNKLDC
jgi:DNA-binding transcriptional LysR family regulator